MNSCCLFPYPGAIARKIFIKYSNECLLILPGDRYADTIPHAVTFSSVIAGNMSAYVVTNTTIAAIVDTNRVKNFLTLLSRKICRMRCNKAFMMTSFFCDDCRPFY